MMPGAGQALQRRWWAAAIYGILFTVFGTWLLLVVFRALIRNFKAVVDFAAGDPNAEIVRLTVGQVVLPFVLALIVFLAGLVDTILAAQRLERAAAPLSPPPVPPDLKRTTPDRKADV